jgi:DNA-binding beta-propeller fold protein YncE
VIDTKKVGNSIDQSDQPTSISMHKKTNVLYVSFAANESIRMFSLDQLSTNGNGVIVASTDPYPERIYVDDDDNEPTIYAAFSYPGHVQKWVKGASSGVQVGEGCNSCAGVSVDKEKNVYISDGGKQLVQKWSPGTNTTKVVAGETGKPGSTNQLLNGPKSIDVDSITGSVYVTDTGNHRVQKWCKGAEEGITVAGSSAGKQGKDSSSLQFPQGVLVDDDTQVVYVADTYNNRIQKWLPAAFDGSTIAGGLRMYLVSYKSVLLKKKTKVY